MIFRFKFCKKIKHNFNFSGSVRPLVFKKLRKSSHIVLKGTNYILNIYEKFKGV